MRFIRVCAAALIVSLFLIFVPAQGLGEPLFSSTGIFTSGCGYSHRLPDDPIVKPSLPGASHSHDFFGNRSTNAFSNYSSLRAGTTLCGRSQDAAAYWVPTLYDGRIAVTPNFLSAYYSGRGKSALGIKPFPAALRIVAGNAAAPGPQPMMITSWTCGEAAATESSSVPLCPFSNLRLHVRFPDCWDGRNLDSADHKSHMAYSYRGVCPIGYGTSVPGLQINIFYPIRGGPSVTLASGSAYTAHGDFFNAWEQNELSRLVRDCLNISRNCG